MGKKRQHGTTVCLLEVIIDSTLETFSSGSGGYIGRSYGAELPMRPRAHGRIKNGDCLSASDVLSRRYA